MQHNICVLILAQKFYFIVGYSANFLEEFSYICSIFCADFKESHPIWSC